MLATPETVDKVLTGFKFTLLAVFVWAIAYVYVDTVYYEIECISSATVEEIVQVEYRSAWVKLSNGKTVELNQPDNLVPGAVHCLAARRVPVDNIPKWASVIRG